MGHGTHTAGTICGSDGVGVAPGARLISARMFDNYGFDSMILAASIRHLMHWHEAALMGADIATIPPKLLDQVMNHPLTEKGIEMFDADFAKLGKKELLD